jgi:hypothetical protein
VIDTENKQLIVRASRHLPTLPVDYRAEATEGAERAEGADGADGGCRG